jgi:4-aminobutyrate aminotransferase/(S)-3-amino-2-methylpropionate transaminase
VIAFTGGYHGLDYAPLALCGYSEAFRAPFAAQLNPHAAFAPYPADDATLGDALGAVERALKGQHSDHAEPIGAVVVEPLLGRGGVVVPPARFLSELSRLCKQHGALLVLDAIRAGLGRNGVWPCGAAELPDLVCLGKALGGGLPVSACVGSAEVMAAWGEAASSTGGVPLHTGTFFGNPLGCATALAALQISEREDLAGRAARLGGPLMDTLRAKLGARCCTVRGAGLLVGIDTGSVQRGLTAMQGLLQAGYITVPAGDGRVISLTPPLTIAQPLLDDFVVALERVLDALPAQASAS